MKLLATLWFPLLLAVVAFFVGPHFWPSADPRVLAVAALVLGIVAEKMTSPKPPVKSDGGRDLR